MDIFTLLDADNVITQKIKTAINKQIYHEGALNSKLIRLSERLHEILYISFFKSETYISLTYGELRAEFGLDENSVNALPELVKKLVSVTVNINAVPKVNNMVTISIGFGDYDDIDFAKDGMFVTEKGDIINWLWWLLSAGESEIASIDQYNVYLKQGHGRSHMAVMIKSVGQSYSVDGYFAGTPHDNWITRTLRENIGALTNTIKEVMNAT